MPCNVLLVNGLRMLLILGFFVGVVSDPAKSQSLDSPCLIPWQRSLDDALLLVEQTGKPLLICANTDGEPASEQLAWRKYRDPEFAALVDGFIPLIVSPDRREPRDYDDRGRRLPDQKFGTLVNRELIDSEPELYQRYFGGQRVAPRHVGVSPEGEILFDLFLLQDLDEIDRALREHGAFEGTPLVTATDETSLLQDPRAKSRERLEQRFVESKVEARLRLVALALSNARAVQHPELIRLALRDPDPEVRRAGAWMVAQHPQKVEVPLFLRALRMSEGEDPLKKALIASAHQVAAAAEASATRNTYSRMARVFSSLERSAPSLDIEDWKRSLRFAPKLASPAVVWWEEINDQNREDAFLEDSILETVTESLRELIAKGGASRDLYRQETEAHLRLAQLYEARRQGAGLAYEAALAAVDQGLEAHPGDSMLKGLRVYVFSRMAEVVGEDPSGIADKALAFLQSPENKSSQLTGRLLEVFAQRRSQDLFSRWNSKGGFPESWIPQIRAAYEILLHHPYGEERHAVEYVQFLGDIQAFAHQGEALVRVLSLHPLANELHRVFRLQLFRDEGAAVVADAYGDWMNRADRLGVDVDELSWYSGFATLMAAERWVESRDMELANSVYAKSMTFFERSMKENDEFADSAQHYISLALSAQADIALQGGDSDLAYRLLTEAIEASPTSMRIPDGLGRTSMDRAVQLRRVLAQEEKVELRETFQAFLETQGVELPGRNGRRLGNRG